MTYSENQKTFKTKRKSSFTGKVKKLLSVFAVGFVISALAASLIGITAFAADNKRYIVIRRHYNC